MTDTAAPAPAPQRPWSDRARLGPVVVLFAGLLIAGVWAAVAAVASLRHADALAAEQRQNANLARALEEQTVRVFAATDQAMLRVRDAVLAEPGALPDLVRFAAETGLAPKILVQLSLVGPDGRFAASNLDPDGSRTAHVDLSEREHIRVHLGPHAAIPGGLFIGKPVLGKVSGKWTIQLSRKLGGPNGTTLGVVVASLDPTYFEGVYRRVQLGAQGTVSLVGTDRSIRARVVGGQALGMGTMLPEGSGFSRHVVQPEGHYTARSGVDGIERLVAFRQIADFPLVVLVGTGTQEALAPWATMRNAMVMLAALVTLLVAGAAAMFVIDVRRLERSNAALRASEAQAQSANQAKSEFLAAISHELRTPLTSIRGFAELMEHRLPDAKYREQAGLIRKGAEHLNTLLGEILDFAKIEAGGMVLAPEPVALRPLVQGTVDFFALAAETKQLTLTGQVADDVPQTIHADGLRLKQVLNNLLSNAMKFTPEGGRVSVTVERRDGELRFHVDDTGPGIPLDKQETIFEKFRQGDARVSFQHGGTGLGLALSRGLATLMQGRLTVQSTPGHGARFTLAIPL